MLLLNRRVRNLSTNCGSEWVASNSVSISNSSQMQSETKNKSDRIVRDYVTHKLRKILFFATRNSSALSLSSFRSGPISNGAFRDLDLRLVKE